MKPGKSSGFSREDIGRLDCPLFFESFSVNPCVPVFVARPGLGHGIDEAGLAAALKHLTTVFGTGRS